MSTPNPSGICTAKTRNQGQPHQWADMNAIYACVYCGETYNDHLMQHPHRFAPSVVDSNWCEDCHLVEYDHYYEIAKAQAEQYEKESL